MKRAVISIFGSMLLAFTACTSGIMSDSSYRHAVEEDFLSRAELLDRAGVELDTMSLTRIEREAMEFLYAYMPLGDILNQTPAYYLENCRLTFRAMDSMPWGHRVPERELRHFVLPIRVNNENLDTSRAVFYSELAPRVRSLSMRDAILEVNHWCHEKAVYQPSDSRTSSPLATVRTAYGRCGEESTLLVAALRSVGIPARQVYTPRWAHTDDNHAWVEAWADGEWHFLGACEPEPVLDLGWFNAPASRGMLMHTKVFGMYDGPEEVVAVTPNHTEINVIDNYAPGAARLAVNVKDADGNPVPGAAVEFRLYNYAEFYPVAVKSADALGQSFLTAGLGDMVVYASDGNSFGFRKVTFGKDTEVDVVLEYDEDSLPGHIAIESVPPAENAVLPEVAPWQREENDRRLAEEDSIRNAYVGTFMDARKAGDFVRTSGLGDLKSVLAAQVAALLSGSRGNHGEICRFLAHAIENGRADDAVALLQSVSEKDLRDTPASVLADHLDNTAAGTSDSHVYCPRVSTELLTPYRGYLLSSVPQVLKDRIVSDPSSFVRWCRDSLQMMDSISMAYVQVSPAKVWETRTADRNSRDIFFVAMCRTFGVPAWVDAVTGTVRYQHHGQVYDVDFSSAEKVIPATGRVVVDYKPIPMLKNPGYYRHFTISRYQDGRLDLLDYDESATWKTVFASGTELPEGVYVLTSGSRMAGGNVLADMEFFTVEKGKTVHVPLTVRDDPSQYRVIGSFNSEALYEKVPAPGAADGCEREKKSVLSETGRGYFAVILADYGSEPVDHVMRDISSVAADLEHWGRPILVVFASEKDWKRFGHEKYSLPETVSYGIDTDGSMRRMMMDGMDLSGDGRLPLIVVADTFNRVVFFSQGYSIGLGDRLLKVAGSI